MQNSMSAYLYTAIQLLFVLLKLCSLVDWSWFAVMSPSLFLIVVFFLCRMLYETTQFSREED